MKHDIPVFIKTCNPCLKTKPNKKQVNSGEFAVPDKRFSHVMVDIVGPLPVSQGYRFLLTCVCRSSRFFRALPLREDVGIGLISLRGVVGKSLSLFTLLNNYEKLENMKIQKDKLA